MSRRTPTFLAVGVVAVTAVGLLSACSGGHKKKVAASTTPSSSASPTPTPSLTKPAPPAAPAPVNPLTGVGAPVAGPVIAVKVDDTDGGRPQRGVDQADVVYIEQAEGGLSRLVAVFDSKKPVVGYVRSVRASDPELLLQYGKITLVASGGGGDALPTLDSSGLTSWIDDRGQPYFSRVDRDDTTASTAYYINVVMDLTQLSAATKTPAAKSTGFTFNANPPALATAPAATDIRTTVGSTAVEFKWDASLKKYVRYIDGERQVAKDGAPITTNNVIVQACQIDVHPQDVDVNGQPSMFTNSIGKGAVMIFRNGKAFSGTWARSSKDGPTSFTNAAGAPIPLTPGNTWVALTATGTPVTAN